MAFRLLGVWVLGPTYAHDYRVGGCLGPRTDMYYWGKVGVFDRLGPYVLCGTSLSPYFVLLYFFLSLRARSFDFYHPIHILSFGFSEEPTFM